MKNLLFIGLEYHLKTGSADFFLSHLAKRYHITYCYVDMYRENSFSVLNTVPKKDFDTLVCWQIRPQRKLLDRLFRYKHASLVPMFDDSPDVMKTDRWFPYRDFNIICFSRTLANRLVRAGFSAKYIQYFPKPFERPMVSGDSESAFIWCRREAINVPLVLKLFQMITLKHIHVHNAPDPGNTFIVPDGYCPVNITYSKWYDEKNAMLADVAESSYYIAPRPKEGIGMSFLEAMAMGRCVVAHDESTMNEYIKHGRTGLLYNIKRPKPFQPVDVRKIQENTCDFMKEGYERWEREKDQIFEWLEASADFSNLRIGLCMVLRFFKNPLKVLKALIEF